MAEEIRSAFIDEVMAIERVDNWTRHILTQKAQSVVVLSFFPARYTANVLVNMMSTKINKAVEWKNKSMDYFLQVSAFMAPSWTAPMHHPLVDRRRGMSIFDTDCHFNPEKNVVVLPLAFYNLSVPTSQKERMFHIPRIGPRLTDCLFRATFATNFFMPNDYYWTNYASSNFDETAKCFGGHYKKNQNASMFTRVEESSGIVVAFEAFEDRLFSKQYLQMDYILDGLPDVTADQLFFIYYALSHCEMSAQGSTASMMNAEERVNVPLMNSFEFSAAFKCANDSKMNPSNKCSFWD
ncbi:neprilysin-3 [Dermacentor silvarum]|uniref:neprilysin-3 n=1 Tax=Dermacentor silvarum TaxID=543639 RepID=UPI0021013B8E|nr:neprilysin-3 [Dermacentor silvarum]